MKIPFWAILVLGLAGSLAMLCIAALAGTADIDPVTGLRILAGAFSASPLSPDISPAAAGIILDIRLPRILLAWLAGAAVSVSGAIMQSVLRNPLASPFTLGVSAGASLGSGLVMLAGTAFPFAGALAILSGLAVPAAGFVSGLAAIFLLLAFSRSLDPRLDTHTVILSGMVLSLFINAALTLVSALAGQEMNRLILWQMGSFALKGWTPVAVLALPVFLGILAATAYSRELDILTFGDEEASAIGVDIKKHRGILIALASALTGATVAFVGVIGFVDLAVPHLVRKITGPGHLKAIPLSALAGGSAMVLADLAARTLIPPLDLPVGAITAIAGAPIFAFIYLSGRTKG